MIYHLLPEPFSSVTGLGIAKVVANMMHFDESRVVCSQADDTWGIDAHRIVVIPELSILSKPIGWRFLPSEMIKTLISHICGSVTSRLKNRDIVWCHNGPYTAAALKPTIHLKGAKLIYHSHNSLAHYRKRPVFRWFTPDAYIFNSEAMRQEALTLFPYLTNTHTVHNGANEALFYPRRGGEAENYGLPVILYVGRLVPYKGVHVLMDAMKILHERKIQAACKIVGSAHAGGNRSKVTPYIKSLYKRCPCNVQFEGFRVETDIAKEYRSADILCCPSIWQEPFGNVNIEAMACGVPVVASRVGGIPEIAAEGGVLLVEPDSAVALADALQRLILDGDLRQKMGVEGLAAFHRRFTWTAISRQHREIVDRLLCFKHP